MSNNRKSRDDYDREVCCADCGTERGPFVRDSADDDIICLSCRDALKSEQQIAYDDANEHARNLTGETGRDGRWLTIRCAHCAAEIDSFDLWRDEESAYQDAAALLEADAEHPCDEEDEA